MNERLEEVYVEFTALPRESMLLFVHGSTKLEFVVPVSVQVVVVISRDSLRLRYWFPISAPTLVAAIMEVKFEVAVRPLVNETRRIGSVDPDSP